MTAAPSHEQRLFKLVREAFPKHKGVLSSESKLSEVAGWDSVSHVSLILDIEDAFGVTIPEEEYFDLVDVSALLAKVAKSEAG